MVAIGFTGTQKGMTELQKFTLRKVLEEYREVSLVRHGDCIGSDAEFHEVASSMGFPIVIHPSDIVKKRAFCTSDTIMNPKPPLERNPDIVNGADILIATPDSNYEQVRSGTWATVRFARQSKRHVDIIVIWPNGERARL